MSRSNICVWAMAYRHTGTQSDIVGGRGRNMPCMGDCMRDKAAVVKPTYKGKR